MTKEPNAPLLRRVGERQWPSAPPDLVAEHAAMASWLGKLQRRIDTLQHDHRQQVAALHEDLMHLRGQTLVLRTATLWGLGGAVVALPTSAVLGPGWRIISTVVPPVWREAGEVICQTGCAGHAHPWRDDEGMCRRTGELCQPTADVQTETDSAGRRQES